MSSPSTGRRHPPPSPRLATCSPSGSPSGSRAVERCAGDLAGLLDVLLSTPADHTPVEALSRLEALAEIIGAARTGNGARARRLRRAAVDLGEVARAALDRDPAAQDQVLRRAAAVHRLLDERP